MNQIYAVRGATRADLDTLVGFTGREAREAEGVEKSVDDVRRGVENGLEDPAVARYWVAESSDGRVVAAVSVVTEWSNFHGGYYWWIQSVFIVPEHRGRGLIDLLLEHVTEAARLAGALDLRLYVRESNRRAMQAYRRCGFSAAPYTIMTRRLSGE
jgi:GNAT superfamily N-acetyltransferase